MQIWNIKIVEVPLPKGLHLPHLEVSPGLYPSGPDPGEHKVEPVDNHHLNSNSSFLICSSLHLGAPGFLGLLLFLGWCARV